MKVMRKINVLTNKVQSGFKVGDQIEIGKYTATCQEVKKNSAIFMFDQALQESMGMNNKNTNEGGYTSSVLREFLNEVVIDYDMFDGIREMMVPFKKTGDLLRIPTVEEMFGPEEAHKHYEALSNKKQWPLMKDRRNRIAFYGKPRNEISYIHLQNRYKKNECSFATVDPSGWLVGGYANDVGGIRLVFRLRA